MTVLQACKELLIEQPFYGLFLLQLDKEESTTFVETACVALNGISSKLVINPNYWATLNDKEQVALLLHEVELAS